MIRRVLVANRGEIAVRIVKACFDEGIESVLAASEVDRDSLAARLADRVVTVGPGPAGESYLAVDRILAAALGAECDGLHPGYGFLSERPQLADACAESGITFVGPPGPVMRRAGDKLAAKQAADAIGIPTGGGSGAIETVEDAIVAATAIGYPAILKATAGGGGRGMSVVANDTELRDRFAAASAEADKAFGDGRVYLEKYVARARHIEVQIMADTHGNVVHLGERDCSCQRRHQKVIEEAPAVNVAPGLLEQMRAAAVELGRELGYVGAGTVECLVDLDREDYSFLEVNARVQVEHPVTEMVTGIDIVREQLRVAAGEPLSFTQADVRISGHAIECRINAEDAARGFAPTPGVITRWAAPVGTDLRVETHCHDGVVISPYYDSLIAKLIGRGSTRQGALALLARALRHFTTDGIGTTVPVVRAVCESREFTEAPQTTRWFEEEFMPSWAAELVA